jgi:hypothetical protein
MKNTMIIAFLILSAGCAAPKTVFPDMTIGPYSCKWQLETDGHSVARLVAHHDEDDPKSAIDAVATFRILDLPNHHKASERLLEIAAASIVPSVWSTTGGWPTINRQFEAPLDRRSAVFLKRTDGNFPAATWARAAGSRLIRVDAQAVPGAKDLLQNLIYLLNTLHTTEPMPTPADQQKELTELVAHAKRMQPSMR